MTETQSGASMSSSGRAPRSRRRAREKDRRRRPKSTSPASFRRRDGTRTRVLAAPVTRYCARSVPSSTTSPRSTLNYSASLAPRRASSTLNNVWCCAQSRRCRRRRETRASTWAFHRSSTRVSASTLDETSCPRTTRRRPTSPSPPVARRTSSIYADAPRASTRRVRPPSSPCAEPSSLTRRRMPSPAVSTASST